MEAGWLKSRIEGAMYGGAVGDAIGGQGLPPANGATMMEYAPVNCHLRTLHTSFTVSELD